MSSNIFWTPEEDEILIDFVRKHDVLYIRHQDYRKAQTKQHLLESIETTLEKSEEKPGSGSSAIAAKKRSALLSFSDSFAVSQRPTTTNVESSQGLSNVIQLSHNEPDIDTTPGIITPEILEHHSNDALGDMKEDKLKVCPQKKEKKKLAHSEERLKLLKEVVERKAAPQNEQDEADLFWIYGEDFLRLPRKE
ncbi:uncharacterized protein TNIN_285061 [Trichonephila inaurata madagascariensis]|uniref:Uncharacterized protein n=1 Tax=Trichonephila inaurata madagascariensis TaxID=2747483 RepID=A0A8X6X8R9_9ARAC|nr:uncharacterized protein TNIN_285061 [Trichonephila inaurata madagascariensis]